MIREVIGGFLDPLDGATEFDAVADFSAPFPVEIISRMLGVPEGERQPIRERLDISLHREHGPARRDAREAWQAVVETGAYFYELAVEKRKNPGDDMMSRLTQVTVDRGDGVETGLDDVEIAGFAGLLGGAGAETVTKLVGNAVVLFARHPDQWQKILDDPDKIPRAVEEILRVRAAVAVPGALLASPTASSKAARSPPASRCCSSPARRRAIRAPSSAPTSSTSNGHRASRSDSGTACTAASAPRSRAWRAASRSRRSLAAGGSSRSTTPGLRRVHMSNVAGYSNIPIRVTG